MASAEVSADVRPDGVAVINFKNGPVNALSGAVQRKISRALRAAFTNPAVRAVVIHGDHSNGFFSGGADISEFASLSSGSFDPEVSYVYDGAEDGPKPVVAAVGGLCFGGGCELAIACSARVATTTAVFSLPELKLGIIPGLGGTQRLPRLIGFAPAMQMMLRSSRLSAADAAKSGLVIPELVADPATLVDAAAAVALEIAQGKRQRVYPLREVKALGNHQDCEEEADRLRSKEIPKLSVGGKMPHFEACLEAALYGVQNGGRAGRDNETRIFADLVSSPTAKSLIHFFFATRATGKIDSIAGQVPPQDISVPKRIAVIGGGLMGAGIATACVAAGIHVIIKEINDKAAQAAQARVNRNLGKRAPRFMPLLTVTTTFDNFQTVDMVIEAALEDVKLKQELFKILEGCTRPDCILASNTSTINLDLIAMRIPKAHAAGRVIGAHFFSPAHQMPLLEIVRAESTSPVVIAQLVAFGKKIRKTPVVVGNCAGFAGNRLYFPLTQVALLLVEKLGISPYRIDKVFQNFGLPMGPFAMTDFVGIDIGAAVGQVFGMAFAERVYETTIPTRLCAAGRKGQKTGAGFYRYDKGSRKGIPDPEALAHFLPPQSLSGRSDGEFDDRDILEMILLPCVNEATRILDEGIALRASDLDVVTVMGYAFPAFYGGMIHWAETQCGGAARIVHRLNQFRRISGGEPIFKPSFAMERAARFNFSLSTPFPSPVRRAANDNEIAIVAAKRSAVGRAGRGGFKDTSADDLLSPVLAAVLKDSGLSGSEIDDIVIGTVLPRGDSGVVQVRVAGVLAGYPTVVPVKTVNRLCSSGLQAIVDAANAISAGDYEIAVAGGLECMSEHVFANTTLKKNPQATAGSTAADCYISMGETSENVALRYGISREKQDRMGVVSHARASTALLSGRQKSEIVPIKTKIILKGKDGSQTVEKEVTVEKDEGVRIGVTKAALSKLRPVFKKNGSTTAGNASQVSDGAAAVVMMKNSEARIRGLKPLAVLKSFAVAGVDPDVMGIGPVFAIPKALEKAGLTVEDMDLIELNEAFGSQSEYCIEKLGLNRDIVNVNGGAIAIGHPLGMTGARQTVSILNELERRKGRYGLVSMCVGTGMGAAAIYELCSDTQAKL